MSRPLILITNDDGIYAPGIQHLWKAMESLADLVIVAPAAEQSGVGMSISIRQPLHIDKVEWHESKVEAWAVKGTPVDCVKIALSSILKKSPDLILSGINRGNNAGRNIIYSGTVAAVMEGTHRNIPGIALSLDEEISPRFDLVSPFVPKLVDFVLTHKLPLGTFLNVNFPKNSPEGIQGVRFTRQGKEYWKENLEERTHPSEGKSYYWLGRQLAQFEEDEDSDICWLRKGFATAVPIHVGELTHHAHLSRHQALFHDYMDPSFRK